MILQWAESTEFTIRFIGLVRNPMAVMYSALELFSTNPIKRQFAWGHCYRNLLAMMDIVGKDRFNFIRYEDLVDRPQQIFEKICTFIGVEPIDTLGQKLHKNAVAKWIEDPAFTLQLHSSVARIAKHFGYTDEDLYNPPKAGLTMNKRFRRYIKGQTKTCKSPTL